MNPESISIIDLFIRAWPVLLGIVTLIIVLAKMHGDIVVLKEKDVIPEYPRINRFLRYWHSNIDAVIASIDLDPYKEHIDGLQEYTITYRQ